MTQATRTYLLVEVEHKKDVPNLTDKVAGRAYTLPNVDGATAILLDSADAYRLAKAQVESHG